jgi:hypothetical protein
MFKARIIDDKDYYSFRSKQLLLLILLSIPLGVLANLFTFSILLSSVIVVGYLYVAFLLFKNAKSIRSTINNSKIELNNESIRILDRFNQALEVYKIEDISEIEVLEEYKLPQEDLKDVVEEIFGKYKISYIQFVWNNECKKINFEIDSNYMLGKLNEVINNWSASGVKLSKVN